MRFDERLRALLARPLVATIAIVGATAWLLWPVPTGRPVLSQDHTVHMFRAWHFFTKELARGHLTGWSDYWFAGWPAGQDYPPGADWWLAAARLLTLPFSWEATYAFGFFAMYVVSALCVWRAARRLGPVAAVLAALLFVLDCGEYREGGFIYSVYWGVWPQQLSSSALLVGLTWLDEAIGSGRPRDLAKAAAAFGASLLCHPLSLVSLGIALPILIALRCLGGRDEPRTPLLPTLGRSLGAAGLGWAMAAMFTLPFGARSGFMAAYGDPFRSLGEIAEGLWRGNVFQNVPPPLVWLSLAGLVVGLCRRERWPIFLGAFALLTLTVASTTSTSLLERISPSLGRIQYQRLVAPAKACLFALAAWSLAPSWGGWLRLAGWVSLIVAPLLVAHTARYPRLVTREGLGEAHAYRQFLDWSRSERAKPGPFYRIAYLASYNDHYFAAAPIENDTPAYKVGFTPAANFVHKPDQPNDDLYRVLSVKWVASRGGLGDPHLVLEQRFGSIFVYRFVGYSPDRFTVEGAGRARVERFESEHIRIALEGTDAASRLALHVAAYPSWRARLDGRAVPIRTVALAGEPIFMEVPADGRLLEIDFVARPVDVVSWLISVAAFLVVGFMLLASDEQRARVWARLPPLTARQLGQALIGGCVVVLAIAVVVKLAKRPAPPAWQAVEQLPSARASLGDGPCLESGARLRCAGPAWSYVGRARGRIGGVRRACVWAHPTAGAPLTVTFAGVPRGRELTVRHGLFDPAVDEDRLGASIRIDVAQDGGAAESGVQPNRKGWFSFALPRAAGDGQPGDVSFTISAPRDHARDFCFDAEVR
ncbi:MAG TPA: hypothetical protein VI456_12800 [Polyangia bacterium]